MPLPTIAHLCLRHPLYEELELGEGDNTVIETLVSGSVKFDAHCPQCGRDSFFSTLRTSGGGAPGSHSTRMFTKPALPKNPIEVQVFCSRSGAHTMRFYFLCTEKHLIKIGQYPSLADLYGAELHEFRKLLGKERSHELFKAIGLAAHGVGIGSFTYLRRVFESLLEDKRKELSGIGREIEDFDHLHVEERIAALSDVLPAFLVENKSIYGILSAGIHSLSEDTCKKAFPVLRDSIAIILKDEMRRQEEQQLRKKLTVSIGAMAGQCKKSAD